MLSPSNGLFKLNALSPCWAPGSEGVDTDPAQLCALGSASQTLKPRDKGLPEAAEASPPCHSLTLALKDVEDQADLCEQLPKGTNGPPK